MTISFCFFSTNLALPLIPVILQVNVFFAMISGHMGKQMSIACFACLAHWTNIILFSFIPSQLKKEIYFNLFFVLSWCAGRTSDTSLVNPAVVAWRQSACFISCMTLSRWINWGMHDYMVPMDLAMLCTSWMCYMCVLVEILYYICCVFMNDAG